MFSIELSAVIGNIARKVTTWRRDSVLRGTPGRLMVVLPRFASVSISASDSGTITFYTTLVNFSGSFAELRSLRVHQWTFANVGMVNQNGVLKTHGRAEAGGLGDGSFEFVLNGEDVRRVLQGFRRDGAARFMPDTRIRVEGEFEVDWKGHVVKLPLSQTFIGSDLGIPSSLLGVTVPS